MNSKTMVDMLGTVQAQIAELEKEEKALKESLRAYGPGAYEGDFFRATVSVAEREIFNAQAAKAKLLNEGFFAFVKKNTSYVPVVTVKVVARNGERLVA